VLAEWLRSGHGAETTWLPFDLHPEYPDDGLPRERLLARYGEEGIARTRALFEANGLDYNPHPHVVPNTRAALRLSELARDHDLHQPFHDRVMNAYWAEARDIGDGDVLRGLAAEVGLDDADVARVLASDEFLDRVTASTAQAASIGITGIPAFLIDRRLLVLGAQPREVFERAFAQLG
jgi:predicted DsbA family dithiol-disulfide isomerase